MSEENVTCAVYDMNDIQKILGIKRTAAYSFIKKAYAEQKPFRVLKIGSIYRIPCTEFDRELKGEN